MEITTVKYKRCDLVKVNGRIDSFTAPQFSEALHALTDSGRCNLVLDMSDVTYISSAGLRVLIDIQKACRQLKRGGGIALASVSKHIYDTLELAGFVPLFKFYDNPISAVGSF